MRKAAWIPWDDRDRNNSIFYHYPDGSPSWFVKMKSALVQRGYDLNTVDLYADLHEVSFFLFGTNNSVWLDRLIRLGLQDRTVYICGEPAVVMPEHSKEGYQRLLRQYAYIMTWNDDLVDGDRIVKRIIPYDFRKDWGDVPFEDRKILVNISGNKHSDQPMELYSAREAVIDYYERSDPASFDLYGTDWDVNRHPLYRGRIPDKFTAYHQYRFALSLENTYGVRGYITEKIFDCFAAGVVPVYLGASDVGTYIPDECYIHYEDFFSGGDPGMPGAGAHIPDECCIHYDDFSSIGEMAAYLRDMPKERWEEYREAIDRFLSSEATQRFAGEIYGNQIADVADRIGQVHLEIPGDVRRDIRSRARRDIAEKLRLKAVLRIKRMLGKA